MKVHPNILMLEEVTKGLGALVDEVVFIGGAVVSLYIDELTAPPVTPSDDVDCVIEMVGRVEYSKVEVSLPSRAKISIFKSPYFLASKLEALKGRGKNDYAMSQDLEDIVTVIEGRREIGSELDLAPKKLQKYLRSEFDALLKHRHRVHEAAQGFLRGPGDPNPAAKKFMEILEYFGKK